MKRRENLAALVPVSGTCRNPKTRTKGCLRGYWQQCSAGTLALWPGMASVQAPEGMGLVLLLWKFILSYGYI